MSIHIYKLLLFKICYLCYILYRKRVKFLDVGEKIKQERQNANMSQKELGEKLGVSQAMIGQYESGKRKPKVETLTKIANALGKKLVDLLTYETELEIDVPKNKYTEPLAKYVSTKFPSKNLIKLQNSFLDLNEKGQEKALEQIELLTKIPEYTQFTPKKHNSKQKEKAK